MFIVRLLAFTALLALVIDTPLSAEDQSTPRQTAETFDLAEGRSIDFLLYLPEGYEDKEAWPLVLFLHGAGERGNDLNLVKKHGPPKLIEGGKDFPFLVVSPQCPAETRWAAEDLTALANHIMEIHNVDPDRFYITGLSMGGHGTWTLAGAMADKVAAIAPICARAEREVVEKIKDIPVWVFHGAKDTAVKLANSEEMVQLLKEQGAKPKFTIYPEAAHDSWTETYENQELYDWLLSHKRPAK